MQTYLGQIEAWLSEPECVVNFLNEVFGEGVVTIGTINESLCVKKDKEELTEMVYVFAAIG